MNIHVNPITSDGNTTIGFDADGVAGEWPGNMTEICHEKDFIEHEVDKTWCDGNQEWTVIENGDELAWEDSEGNWHDADSTLRIYADR